MAMLLRGNSISTYLILPFEQRKEIIENIKGVDHIMAQETLIILISKQHIKEILMKDRYL
jgi:hypothetical protein